MATELKTEAEVLEALRNRYDRPAWALFAGVANGTGTRASRWADAVGMSLWPSRGLAIMGFEIKVSRRDLLRELKKPKKADAVGKYCDYWWIAAGSKDVVKDPSELPPAWGLLVPHGNTMKVVRDAQRLEPQPLDRGFVAAILRRADEKYDHDAIRQQVRDAVFSEVEKNVKGIYKSKIMWAEESERKTREELTKIQRQLQIATNSNFTTDLIGRAIHLLHNLDGWRGAAKTLEAGARDLTAEKERIDQSAATLREAAELCQTLLSRDEESREEDESA